ncbi:MAG: MarR family transcriptional regulator [Candidatus Omnitrophica bacterium]|nr:MarR family transcriptional regulator [Candidatus Omnitrophota bacterium]
MSINQFSKKMVIILPKVMRLMTKRQSNELFKGKITLPQFIVMEFLYREGPAMMSKIAEILSVSAPAATGIVDKLVRDAYLIRESAPESRRIILIKLTKKGKKLVERTVKQRQILIKDIFGKLEEKERQQYLYILNKIYKVLQNNHKGTV